MFEALKIRWLVTALVATATLVLAAPAGARPDLERMNGVGHGSLPPVNVEQGSILSNAVHEGRLAEHRLGAQGPVSRTPAREDFIPGVTDSTTGVMAQVRENERELPFTRPDSDPRTVAGDRPSVAVEVRELPFTRPDSDPRTVAGDRPSVAVEVRNRDNVVTDKAAPQPAPIPYLSQGQGVDSSFGETYIPGVTDSTTGVFRDLGIETPPVAAPVAVSDDGFEWSSDVVIGISAALLTALLMAGTLALVSQRRRRMAL